MIDLNNKSILLFSPSFFGYEVAICDKLRSWGAKVDYFDERPANNFWSKALIRVNKGFIIKKINEYYNSIYHNIKEKTYNYIFVINIEAMPHGFLQKMRTLNPEAKFILYMWDSVLNKKLTQGYFPFFDVIYSFDKNDTDKLPNVKFRPLFYMDDYKKLKANKSDYQYDIAFIGTGHSDRYVIMKKIREYLHEYGLRYFVFMYMHSRKLFYWNKVTNKSFKNIHVDEFDFTPISKNEVLKILNKTRIIIDIQHPQQTGLTMRTIEMLGAEKKLITTNKSISEYDFYNAENILIIERENPVIPLQFIQSAYTSLPEDIYKKYSISGWLEEIFSN